MRILRPIVPIAVMIVALAIMLPSSHAADPSAVEPVLTAAILQSGPVSAPYPSLIGADSVRKSTPTDDPTGDTFGGEPLAQDAAAAVYLDNNTTSSFTFDAVAEDGGDNILYAAAAIEMRVTESFTPSAVGGTVMVEISALDPAGAPTDWVPTGAIGPNGIYTAWRADVGSTAATDPIDILSLNPGDTINVLSSGFTTFDLGGSAIGTFALALDTSDATSVSGVGVVGLGGADIAGFGLGSIQMFWEYEVIPVPVELQSFSIE